MGRSSDGAYVPIYGLLGLEDRTYGLEDHGLYHHNIGTDGPSTSHSVRKGFAVQYRAVIEQVPVAVCTIDIWSADGGGVCPILAVDIQDAGYVTLGPVDKPWGKHDSLLGGRAG